MISPLLAHASTIQLPQKNIHAIAHNQPNGPCTFTPTLSFQIPSSTQPTPIIRKKNVTEDSSVPSPAPHTPKSCMIPETKNAPITPPARPKNGASGFAPQMTKGRLNAWCQRIPQKSPRLVAIHGSWKMGGHCSAS